MVPPMTQARNGRECTTRQPTHLDDRDHDGQRDHELAAAEFGDRSEHGAGAIGRMGGAPLGRRLVPLGEPGALVDRREQCAEHDGGGRDGSEGERESETGRGGGIEPGPQEVSAARDGGDLPRATVSGSGTGIGRVGVRMPFDEQRSTGGGDDCEETNDDESHERPFVPIVGPVGKRTRLIRRRSGQRTLTCSRRSDDRGRWWRAPWCGWCCWRGPFVCGVALRDGTSFDQSISERVERRRTDGWNAVTHILSLSASTLVIVGIAAGVVIVSLVRRHRDGVAMFVFAMIGEVVMFLILTAVVDRPRPDVVRLDPAPPTSSFPSGHTYAALVLWGSIAALAYRQHWAPSLRRTAMVLAIVLPLAVGASRIYRGMHHPTDVIASLILGLLWVGCARDDHGPARPGGCHSESSRALDDRAHQEVHDELSPAGTGTRGTCRGTTRWRRCVELPSRQIATDAISRLRAAGRHEPCPFAGVHDRVDQHSRPHRVDRPRRRGWRRATSVRPSRTPCSGVGPGPAGDVLTTAIEQGSETGAQRQLRAPGVRSRRRRDLRDDGVRPDRAGGEPDLRHREGSSDAPQVRSRRRAHRQLRPARHVRVRTARVRGTP